MKRADLKKYNDDIYENKSKFVKEVIEPLINYCNSGWNYADYTYNEDEGTESITLKTVSGGKKIINVHLDSLIAMVIDVMKEC